MCYLFYSAAGIAVGDSGVVTPNPDKKSAREMVASASEDNE